MAGRGGIDPVTAVAALVVGLIASAAVAATGARLWLVVPAGLGVAALVIGVNAVTSAAVRGHAEDHGAVASARRLVRRTGVAAAEIRSAAITAPDAEAVVAGAARVVGLVYRLGRHVGAGLGQDAATEALRAMALGASRLEQVAGRFTGDAAGVVEDLGALVVSLEAAERGVLDRPV